MNVNGFAESVGILRKIPVNLREIPVWIPVSDCLKLYLHCYMQADVARVVQDTPRPPSLWAATLTASSCVLLPSQCHAHEQYNLTRAG